MAWVCGLPCSSNNGGPEPPRRSRMRPSLMSMCSSAKPSKNIGALPRSLSLQPACDPLHRIAHGVGRSRIGEADERTAMDRIEIDAGGRGHMRLFQHLLREGKAVGGELRHVGIEIERAVR